MGMLYSPKFVSKMFKGGNKKNKARYLGLILFESLDVDFCQRKTGLVVAEIYVYISIS